MSSTPKLTYFNLPGRAEIPRLLFAAGNVIFEDVRVTGEEFARLKPTLPAGQLPILEVDGVVYNQSKAIEQYAARRAGLYPLDPAKAVIADIVRETFADASGPITAALFGPADKKDAVVAELREKTFPALLTRLNTLLAGNEWFTGSLSYADVVTYVALNIVDSLGGDATAFPALKAVQARVGALPGIVAYRALRAVRDKAPTLKLTYFNGTGRAEITRLLLSAAGIAFEDIRLSGEEFARIKPTLPAGQLPILEADGVVYNQSKAIEQYAARISGLYPADLAKALVVDVVRETFADASGPVSAAIYGPADKKEAAIADLRAKTFPAFLTRVNALLGDKEFFTGSLSYADITVFHTLNTIEPLGADTAAFPALKALQARVAAVPGIAAYTAARSAAAAGAGSA